LTFFALQAEIRHLYIVINRYIKPHISSSSKGKGPFKKMDETEEEESYQISDQGAQLVSSSSSNELDEIKAQALHLFQLLVAAPFLSEEFKDLHTQLYIADILNNLI
jgi:hypothetical protein